ncbi:hypothetical protein D3870_09785 [Noviherbaspirillum cavernae]|uniref:Uncharacterized protein n=1 Tax=Noviherbaspirillum cavernae TaxID=2320862 RepID=A0A418X1D1_9BURK|nr:hypothetical protein [Noviherbaspirillum cavernae]RJG06263.1 hypothetical protein D3870_09785 [Noviherbaspirillum cavernae]
MAKMTPMAPDSAGFKVLSRLYDLNGVAPILQLRNILFGGFRSPKQFEQVAMVPLTMRGLVKLGKRDTMMITAEGRVLVEAYRRSMPTPRVVSVNTKPLDLAKHYSVDAKRAGSMDYRTYPSVMGDERVPYTGSYSGVSDK